MHSLADEIKAFSKASLKKQSTRVTTITGKRLIETLRDARVQIVEDAHQMDGACGYVEDTSLDLKIGVVKPWLMLASQDVAHDYEKLKDNKNGIVLVHCNAGVSRSASIAIGYLMWENGLSFKDAFSIVKNARQTINPNPGFMEQLRNYQPKK
ncbi:dual specificity protein phosphatase 19 isoform X2 [Cetorhinus maximus]